MYHQICHNKKNLIMIMIELRRNIS